MELDFNDEMIEKMLLKKALVDRKWLNILSSVFDSRWFSVKNMSTILMLVVKYYGKYGTVPSNKVISAMVQKYGEKNPELDVQAAEVNELLAEVSSIDVGVSDEAISTNLKEFIRRKAFYEALMDNTSLLEKDPTSYGQVVEKCLENFDRVQKITFNDVDLGLNYFDPAAMVKHWEYIRNPEAKIKTGWTSLDFYTHGGFLKDGRSLYLVMAQAGLGKSVFLSNLAVNFLKQDLGVVVISLEMSEDVYGTRFDAHISRSDINKLQENEESVVAAVKKFHADHPKARLYVKEFPPKTISCNEIEVYLENLKNAGHEFDVVIVDYLNLLKGTTARASDNMFSEGLEVSEKLRAISYKFLKPVISAVQANSEGMNNEDIGMEHISQSRGVAFTADFLIALYQSNDSRERGEISGRLLKNRLGGRVGKVLTFGLDADSLCLTDKSCNDDIPEAEPADPALKGVMDTFREAEKANQVSDVDVL